MKNTTIEQYLDDSKRFFNQCIKEVEGNPITTNKLKFLFLEKSDEIGVERKKFERVLKDIEFLFDEVPDEEYIDLLTNYFDEISKLNGFGFESWLNNIEFNRQIEDDLKISYLCRLYDIELIQWFLNALKDCPTNPKQKILVYLQSYVILVEGFFSKILNILIYAMIKTSIDGSLVINYSNGGRKKLKNYNDVSKSKLFQKLLVLQNDSTYKELSGIAKVCNKDLRNAVAHHSYKLNETEQKIEFERGQLSFNEFIKIASELAAYQIILVECFHYYSMKCYFESKGFLTD